MNKLLLGIMLLLGANLSLSYGQSTDAFISVESCVLQEDGRYAITLSSTEKFIVGGNRYILHSSGTYLQYSSHPSGNEYKITFYASSEQIALMNGTTNITLVYGLYEGNKKQDGEGDINNGFEGKHWKVNGQILKN